MTKPRPPVLPELGRGVVEEAGYSSRTPPDPAHRAEPRRGSTEVRAGAVALSDGVTRPVEHPLHGDERTHAGGRSIARIRSYPRQPLCGRR